MFLFYGFGSCDSSIRNALLYHWPLLLSGGSPCFIGRESNPEPTVPYGTFNGTRQQYECLRQCLAPLKLTWEHGPGLSWSQVLFTNSTIHIHTYTVFGLLISLSFRADWSAVTKNPAWNWFLEDFLHTNSSVLGESSQKSLDSTQAPCGNQGLSDETIPILPTLLGPIRTRDFSIKTNQGPVLLRNEIWSRD